MKGSASRCLAAALWIVLSGSAAAQAPGGASAGDRDIRAREDRLVRALHERDRTGLEALLSPDYVLRGTPDVGREDWIRNTIALCWGDRSDVDRFRARLHGDVAVASFELTFYVDPATCRPALVRSLITDVWVRTAGGWQLQVRHAAPPPPAKTTISAQYGIVREPPPTWDINSDLSLVATGGNTSTRTLGVGSTLAHRTDGRNTRASVAFLTSEVDGATNAESLALQARHGLDLGSRLQIFGEGSFARDRFAGIGRRTAATLGIAYAAVRPRPHALTFEGGLGVTRERRLDGRHRRFATASGAVSYAWTILPGWQLTERAMINADLVQSRNWRGTSATAVTVTLTRLLSLKASHAFEYRNAPVAGFGRRDMRTAAALVFSFQRRPASG
jgi:putative salt-induced outer membrane protein YdiY